MTELREWPEPIEIQWVGRYPNRGRFYPGHTGLYPSSTTVLGVLGLSTEGLMSWATKLEREATLEASFQTYADSITSGENLGSATFRMLTEDKLKGEKKHQKELKKAGEIGTAVHKMVEWTLRKELGIEEDSPPALEDKALWAFMAWEDWWKGSGYKPYKIEQAVFHDGDDVCGAFAGTIDLAAEGGDIPKGQLGIKDLKSSKGLYLDHHLQLASYCKAGQNYADIRPEHCHLVRVPKNPADPGFEVRKLGHDINPYEKRNRMIPYEDLLSAFASSVNAYNILMRHAA